MKKIFNLFLVLLVTFCLIGCLDINEELWINQNKTGRLKIDLDLSERYVGFMESIGSISDETKNMTIIDLEKIRKNLFDEPSVKRVDIQRYSDFGKRHYVVDLIVNDFHDLPRLSKIILASYEENQAGEEAFEFQDINKGELIFHQKMIEQLGSSESESSESSEQDSAAEGIASALLSLAFGDDQIKVIVHSSKITESNGDISDRSKTVTWKVPLSNLALQEDLHAILNY